MMIEFSQKVLDERRFAATDFAGDDSEAGAVHDAEFEHRKCQPVALAPIDQVRVWQNGEGLLSETVKRLIHPEGP